MSQDVGQSVSQAVPRQPDNSSAPSPASPSSATSSSWTRPLKQFGLFSIGAGFLAASVAVSRRSVIRRQRQSFPKFYSSNGSPSPTTTPISSRAAAAAAANANNNGAEGALLAVQALGLATLNVSAFAVMLTGGLSWAFDLSSLDELRERTRAALSRPGLVDPEDEREFELMMDNLLARLGMDKIQKDKPSEASPEE